MKLIPLTKNKKTIVDDKDYRWLSKHKWYFSKSGYAIRKLRIGEAGYKEGKNVMIHNEIIGRRIIYGGCVDHINGNKLDNRRSNLRVVTRAENTWNSEIKKNNKNSKVKGVAWHKRDKLWYARIRKNGRRLHLGFFKEKEDAQRAYLKASRKYHKKHART